MTLKGKEELQESAIEISFRQSFHRSWKVQWLMPRKICQLWLQLKTLSSLTKFDQSTSVRKQVGSFLNFDDFPGRNKTTIFTIY